MWTTDPPNDPGFYWWRESHDSPARVLELVATEKGVRIKIGLSVLFPLYFGGLWHSERIKEPPA
jgi:hypothetical protein